MKKLITLMLAAAIAAGTVPGLLKYESGYTSAYAAETDNSEEAEDDEDESEATASPAPEEATPEPDTAVDENIGNPEDSSEETGPVFNGGAAGAAGGLGFEGSKFPDCSGHWAEQLIKECTDKNYLEGYEDGNFYPDNPVTASEFSKIFAAWRGSFYQLTDGYWATPYIIKMLDDGIFEQGDYSDYNVPMTRAQVAKAVICSLKGEYFPESLDKYKEMISDIDDAEDSLKDYVIKAYISGIITGYDDGTLKPNSNVTRAEILNIIKRTVTPDLREIPKAVTEAEGKSEELYIDYTAAVQVRKNNNEDRMNYRLYGKNAKYMNADDDATGLKISEEMQGQQGFAFLMRYDLSELIEHENAPQTVSLTLTRESGGDMDLGLYWYENKVSNTDWNNSSYMQVMNSKAVAGTDKAGYNAVVDNISALLPSWGDMEKAVSPEKKTQPFAQAKLNGEEYYFELSLDELKEHMDENNIVEFFVTSVNYDGYELKEENKPKCYVAGGKAPQLCAYFASEGDARPIRVLADTAELEGGMLNVFGSGEDSYVENFRNNQKMTFKFKANSPGKYNMKIYYSANVNSGGGTVTFNLNGNSFDHEFAQTGGWSYYVYEDIGTVELKAGTNILELTDKEIPNTYLINVKNIVFEKAN
ncbi:MAG: S-layer homology domain-containing protein [bacterium]|nr:S-layer homology domain-containing protein [bacterium]